LTQATDQKIVIEGPGQVDLAELSVKKCNVSIGGNGNCTVSVMESLNVSIAGSGKVNYVGAPEVSKSISGVGKIAKIN